MNYFDTIGVQYLADLDRYVVINEELNPFISLCFLLGIDYNRDAIKIIDLIIEKGIRDYLESANYYDVINMAIGDYVSQLPKPNKLNPSYFSWSSENGVEPMNLSYMLKLKSHYFDFTSIYKALLMAFCWGLNLIPVFINEKDKIIYMTDIGITEDNFIYFVNRGDEQKTSVYPLVDNQFKLISSQDHIPGFEMIMVEDSYSYLDYIGSAIFYTDPANPDLSLKMKKYNMENVATYALYAAMGLDILRTYFEQSVSEEHELYKIMYAKVSNHDQLNSKRIARSLNL